MYFTWTSSSGETNTARVCVCVCVSAVFVLLSSAGVTAEKTHAENPRTDGQMSRLLLQYSLSPSLIYTPPWASFSQAGCDEALPAFCTLYLFPFIYFGRRVEAALTAVV